MSLSFHSPTCCIAGICVLIPATPFGSISANSTSVSFHLKTRIWIFWLFSVKSALNIWCLFFLACFEIVSSSILYLLVQVWQLSQKDELRLLNCFRSINVNVDYLGNSLLFSFLSQTNIRGAGFHLLIICFHA